MKLHRMILIGALIGSALPVSAQMRTSDIAVSALGNAAVTVTYNHKKCSEKFPILVSIKNNFMFPITNVNAIFAARFANKRRAECAASADFKEDVILSGATAEYCYDTLESNPPVVRGVTIEESMLDLPPYSQIKTSGNYFDGDYLNYTIDRWNEGAKEIFRFIDTYAIHTSFAREYYEAKQPLGCFTIPEGVIWEGTVTHADRFLK